MTALADNPAVTNPRKALTRRQQDALCTVGFFKNQRQVGRTWFVGNKRISNDVIRSLVAMELVAGHARGLSPTTAGKVAIAKLKGEV